ncbi:protein artemis-like isoform X1 [Diprion similis]|uniref:protein artemis-like isoform X1 n=1 Tax=Diprion similis TaxID=362088 RepID=UPI001EF863B2|nr:protein artemis-like isoform X1 [Diprion similis]
MSTFLGQISEIPGISVDRFNGANLESSAFFLSHCHSDHMKGLDSSFFRHLIESDKYLYCSPISKAFLMGIIFGLPEDRIREIELSIPKIIRYTVLEGEASVVTSLTVSTSPTGHCPGSVMFIFTKDEKSILYSGDFRINPKDLPKLNPLNHKIDGKNQAKKFNTIYLDTTFLSLDFLSFPSRLESCEVICDAVRKWLDSNSKNVVIIECSALYGSEHLFMEMFRLLNLKIHVKDKIYSNYMRISELAKCITLDGRDSRIHACTFKWFGQKNLTCRSDVNYENILTIVPSVLRWKGKNTSCVSEYDTRNTQRLYVCYSAHSSYEELRAFVDYFKPDKIVPCVCPSESTTEFHQLLSELMSYQMKLDVSDQVSESFNLEPPFKRVFKKPFVSKYFADDDNENDEL